jgi:2,4-dienoyl-CoA reductase-like NADH-dependent reductase (Old Yellow Enzyme family)
MTTYSSNIDLTLSTEEERYYNVRAKSFGMVITAATAVSKHAQAFEHQISIRDNRYLASMKRLATAIKSENSVAILQLHHGGRMNQPNLMTNQRILAPSARKADRDYAQLPEAMTISEIYDTIDDFKAATKRAYEAGFDGVELHGANTYLLQQFFSEASNQRTDEFGGSLDNRLRFIKRLIEAVLEVRKEMERPFIIGYRFSPEEVESNGITISDTLKLVQTLKTYDLDYLHISIRRYDATSLRDETDTVPIVKQIQHVLKNELPLIGVGELHKRNNVEAASRLGYDLFAIGMAALIDPFVPEKIIRNNPLKTTLDDASTLPSPLKKRLLNWSDGLTKKGFSVK